MKRRVVSVLLACAAIWAGTPGLAGAQVNCETIPAGPARTDCYFGLSRIGGQKSEIAAGVAKQQADTATYRKVTGKSPKKKVRRKGRPR